jgi:hypothetical protein
MFRFIYIKFGEAFDGSLATFAEFNSGNTTTGMEIESTNIGKEKRKRTSEAAGGFTGVSAGNVIFEECSAKAPALLAEFFSVTLGHFCLVEGLGEMLF